MRIALYQPEIPQNTGTLIRLSACLGTHLDIIDPCGFVWDDRKLRRAGMDYMDMACVTRYPSWESFFDSCHVRNARIVLLTPDAPTSFLEFNFHPLDVFLLGKESTGIPPMIANQTQASLFIPMVKGCRSLNLAISGAMVLTEALRQTAQFP